MNFKTRNEKQQHFFLKEIQNSIWNEFLVDIYSNP